MRPRGLRMVPQRYVGPSATVGRCVRSRYRHRLGHGDVGSRVTIRRWVDDPERGPIPSDVVGHLESWADGVLTIRTRSGDAVAVDEGSILASKVIPPRP